MSKQILYGEDARRSIKEGIDAVADAVKSTLGPGGRTVILDNGYGGPNVTKDGVTVAKSIELNDKLKNAGAKLIRKVSSKTADDAGDGTTTATVIAQAIINEGTKRMHAGINPLSIKRGIDTGVKLAVEYFKNNSIPVSDPKTLKSVATISANGDSEIGEIVSNAIDKIGTNGIVTIDTSNSIDTYVEMVQGLRFDRGYISNYFITDPTKLVSELKDPYILITDQRISTIKMIKSILEQVAMNNKPLFIISDNVDGEALVMLVVNKSRGTLSVAAVKAPAFGDRRKKELEDIAIITGGKVISEDSGIEFDKITLDMLGTADKVVVDSKNTTIIGGKGDPMLIEDRSREIQKLIEDEKSEYNKNALRERLAKIDGGVAILYVGAMTEVELSEKKDRIDDALCAARAANEEGILPGGGTAYLKASVYLNSKLSKLDLTDDEKIGFEIIIDSLKAPVSQIAENAIGEGYGKVVISEMMNLYGVKGNTEASKYDGFDANSKEYVNMIESGIIDPAKVCRVTLENAASIAGMYLTTNCVIIDENEKVDEDK